MGTVEGDRSVLGFYALRAFDVRADLEPEKRRRSGGWSIPAIYVQAVAVREDKQGEGLGNALMIDAMKRCLRIAEEVAVKMIVLDVLDDDHIDRRRKFYENLGFRSLEDSRNPLRMYILISDARNILG